jgi:hypothetical protein
MAGHKSGPRRFYIFGIPVTYELLLRIAILIITIGLLVFAAIPKVRSILDQVNYVSVKVTNTAQIPIPDILICSEFLDSVELDIITRTQYDDGRQGVDVKEAVNKGMSLSLSLLIFNSWNAYWFHSGALQLSPTHQVFNTFFLSPYPFFNNDSFHSLLRGQECNRVQSPGQW